VEAEEDTALRHWDEEPGLAFQGIVLLEQGQQDTLLIGWRGGVSLVTAADVELGETQTVDPSSAVAMDVEWVVFYGEFAAVDREEDGVDEWVFPLRCYPGYGSSCGQAVGAFVCDVGLDVVVPTDCTPMGDTTSTEVAKDTATGDLDGDGLDEVVSAHSAANGEDGFLEVYHADGTALARIEGTHGAMFGLNPTIVTDGHGDPWLLVAQMNLSGNDPGTVWAFRGEHVVGQLVDEDADKVFQTGSGRLGWSMAEYQETPSSPRWLLMSTGQGAVYMVPFDDP
jgi:hypothetical protein